MFIDLIRSRRSIRKFKTKSVEKEKIDLLVESALRAPSSRGLKPWQFIFVQDQYLIQRLSESKTHGSAFLKNAPLAVAVCADCDESDVWIEDTSIASIFLHLAAHDLGLGSCWIQIRKRSHTSGLSSDAYIKEVLKLPDNIMIESIIAIGYPDEIKNAHSKDSLPLQKVSFIDHEKG